MAETPATHRFNSGHFADPSRESGLHPPEWASGWRVW